MIGALFKYETRNRKRTNLMVFLRPIVLRDEKSAASITSDRYDYIRHQQSDIKLPWNVLLPAAEAKPMPPIDEQKSKPLGMPQ